MSLEQLFSHKFKTANVKKRQKTNNSTDAGNVFFGGILSAECFELVSHVHLESAIITS